MISYDEVAKHYSNKRVKEEIARFAIGRWVGLHCSKKDERGRGLLVRYLRESRIPLSIENLEDVEKLLQMFNDYGPRTFYATANIYRSLRALEDIIDMSNILMCTPTWDIDNELKDWEATIATAREIVSFLESCGIRKSVFVKWSGKGAHVHIHQEAISREALARNNPLDIAYAIVEYVNQKLNQRFNDLIVEMKAEKLHVDNEMDPQRMFSCPLSLHREASSVCVCIEPNELDDFTPEWSSIDGYRHYDGWNKHIVGEADDLALKAFETVGGSPSTPKLKRRKHPPLDKQIMEWIEKIGEENL
ncbi:MAG: hypothetical protein ACUVTL_11110 [Thermoproteota archaeon]